MLSVQLYYNNFISIFVYFNVFMRILGYIQRICFKSKTVVGLVKYFLEFLLTCFNHNLKSWLMRIKPVDENKLFWENLINFFLIFSFYALISIGNIFLQILQIVFSVEQYVYLKAVTLGF